MLHMAQEAYRDLQHDEPHDDLFPKPLFQECLCLSSLLGVELVPIALGLTKCLIGSRLLLLTVLPQLVLQRLRLLLPVTLLLRVTEDPTFRPCFHGQGGTRTSDGARLRPRDGLQFFFAAELVQPPQASSLQDVVHGENGIIPESSQAVHPPVPGEHLNHVRKQSGRDFRAPLLGCSKNE